MEADTAVGAPALRDIAGALRSYALGLPGAYEDHPWGELVAKVNKKIFVFFGTEAAHDSELVLGLKLPRSGADVLSLPIAAPAGYGLGKSGWVTLRLQPGDSLPIDLLRSWLLESYCAVAPRRLVAQLGQDPQ